MDRISIYDTATIKMSRDLEVASRPWTKPWNTGVGKAGISFPASVTTGINYKGVNVLLLLWTQESAATVSRRIEPLPAAVFWP